MPLLPAFWMGSIAYALQVLSTGGTLVYPRSPAIDDLSRRGRAAPRSRCLIVWHRFASCARADRARIDIDRVREGWGRRPATCSGERIPRAGARARSDVRELRDPQRAERIDCPLPEDKPRRRGERSTRIERRVVDPTTGRTVPRWRGRRAAAPQAAP